MSNDTIRPIGVVLTEEQMPIGYDRRSGDKMWFDTAPPGMLYAERDIKHLLNNQRKTTMTTTVKDVIEHLQQFDPDLPVITSTDDEGNGYRHVTLDWIGVEGYSDENNDIEVGKLQLTEEDIRDGWTEEDVKPNPCVVIG